MLLLVKLVDTLLSVLGEKLDDFSLSKIEEDIFESLGSDLRALCAKASDVDWNIKQAERCGQRRRKPEVEDWLVQVLNIEKHLHELVYMSQTGGIVRQFLVGGQATELDATVIELVEQSKHFGDLSVDVYKIQRNMLVNESMAEDFNKNLEHILSVLLVDKVSITGICGMAGVGKTEFAKLIHNRLLEQTKERVVWITVSKEFTITGLQIQMAKLLGLNLPNKCKDDGRALILNKMLTCEKNFVLIFDDVWEEINLEKLGDPLSVDGCRLLVTTRSEKVCHQLGCQKVIMVKKLNENEARSLFKETCGQKRHHAIGESTVKLCDGLPLRIITIAGSMKLCVHAWNGAWAEFKESVTGRAGPKESFFKRLKYSSDSLNKTQRNNDFEKMPSIPDAVSSNYLDLSTLLLENICFDFILMFSNIFRFLCILNLSGSYIEMLPDSLTDLVTLKALILKECENLVYVPCLGKLKELKELDFTNTAIEKVPQGMDKLISLKFLLLDKTYKLKMLPRGFLLRFPNLHCLHLPYHMQISGDEVAGMIHLEEFRGRVKDADAKTLFTLIRRMKSLAYSFEAGSDLPHYRTDEFRGYNQLILSRYNFKEANDEDMAVLLARGAIRHLKLHLFEAHSSCLVEDLSGMSHPSLLESLEVHRCEKIECLSRRGEFRGPNAVFPSLKQLEIFYCNKIKELGLFVSELANLEKMTIAYCEVLEDIMEVNAVNKRGESREEIEDDIKVNTDIEGEAATNTYMVSLPKLKCLFLEELPSLKSFCNGKVICNSIETISIWGCPTLKDLPLYFNQSNRDSPRSAPESILKFKDEMKQEKKLDDRIDLARIF